MSAQSTLQSRTSIQVDVLDQCPWSAVPKRKRTTTFAPRGSINRYYDPSTDSFISVDPDVQQTDQPYVFVNDDPLNATDPLGLDGKQSIQKFRIATTQYIVPVGILGKITIKNVVDEGYIATPYSTIIGVAAI